MIESARVNDRCDEWTVRAEGRSFAVRRLESRTDADLLLDADLVLSWHLETWPGATAPPADVWHERIRQRSLPPHTLWLVSDESGNVVGSARFFHYSSGAAWLALYVESSSRRHRIATALLADVVDTARRVGVSTFYTSTVSTIPAGEHFVARLNATLRQLANYRELPVVWSDRAEREIRPIPGEPDVRLEIRSGPCPEPWVNSYATLMRSLGVLYGYLPSDVSEDSQREAVRSLEYSLARSGIERWMMCAVINEELVGVSQYLWDPYEPDVLTDDGIAVADTYRRRRIPYLFLSRLSVLVRSLPSVRRIRIKSLARTPGGLARSLLSAPTGFVHSESHWSVPV